MTSSTEDRRSEGALEHIVGSANKGRKIGSLLGGLSGAGLLLGGYQALKSPALGEQLWAASKGQPILKRLLQRSMVEGVGKSLRGMTTNAKLKGAALGIPVFAGTGSFLGGTGGLALGTGSGLLGALLLANRDSSVKESSTRYLGDRLAADLGYGREAIVKCSTIAPVRRAGRPLSPMLLTGLSLGGLGVLSARGALNRMRRDPDRGPVSNVTESMARGGRTGALLGGLLGAGLLGGGAHSILTAMRAAVAKDPGKAVHLVKAFGDKGIRVPSADLHRVLMSPREDVIARAALAGGTMFGTLGAGLGASIGGLGGLGGTAIHGLTRGQAPRNQPFWDDDYSYE